MLVKVQQTEPGNTFESLWNTSLWKLDLRQNEDRKKTFLNGDGTIVIHSKQ